ncbi:hypothetical protein SULPSESMR1_02834 [Pseudosulfitobacter pseudonitzschiae]|uniref:Uncharacterized protein n=1 Tax=Pseudosulfitobacter pseudonitzschiae TaxID=1402135 RepID=A0A221K3N7_9RHOB|nr:hypothetical protein SULPSESMR1_02834 [Pseudosulfitobacter pseudonitzschiae]
MSLHYLIRQVHRWASIVFTVFFILVFIASMRPQPVEWVFYLPLAPLFVMLPTGLYLFALPYFQRARSGNKS